MKKSFYALSIIVFLLFAGLNLASGQQLPDGQPDTINMDTNAKPEFYYSVEDENHADRSGNGSASTVLIIGGVIVIAGVGGYLLMKKKK
jgi:LPXTG-motif cell wall-anchored protein